jgi:hypothetical protein
MYAQVISSRWFILTLEFRHDCNGTGKIRNMHFVNVHKCAYLAFMKIDVVFAFEINEFSVLNPFCDMYYHKMLLPVRRFD